jgi:hypothetical protein
MNNLQIFSLLLLVVFIGITVLIYLCKKRSISWASQRLLNTGYLMIIVSLWGFLILFIFNKNLLFMRINHILIAVIYLVAGISLYLKVFRSRNKNADQISK